MQLLYMPLSFARAVLFILAHLSHFPHNTSFLRTASIIANILLFIKEEQQSTLNEGEE